MADRAERPENRAAAGMGPLAGMAPIAETAATDAPEQEIARLAAKVEALEAALAKRSRLLRLLQRYLSARDLVLLSRLEDGLTPLPWHDNDLAAWEETTSLRPAEVGETLEELWASLAPPQLGDDPA